MYIQNHKKSELLINLRDELLSAEKDRLSGITGCTLDELDKYLDDIIAETEKRIV
ncbi:MAG: hypothetical protein ACI4HN_02545 [Ruminococcus sp.]